MRKPFDEMSREEIIAFTADLRNELKEKKFRDRQEIDECAKRRIHDLSVVLMEQDQILLQEAIYFLEHIERLFGPPVQAKSVVYPVKAEG